MVGAGEGTQDGTGVAAALIFDLTGDAAGPAGPGPLSTAAPGGSAHGCCRHCVSSCSFECVFDNYRLRWHFLAVPGVRVIDPVTPVGAARACHGVVPLPVSSGSAGGSLVGVAGGAEVLQGGAEVSAAAWSGGVGTAVVPRGK